MMVVRSDDGPELGNPMETATLGPYRTFLANRSLSR